MGCSSKARGFLKLSISHVVLVLSYFMYLFMGSLLFHFLERTPQSELEVVHFHDKDETIRQEIMTMILNCSETTADEEILDDLLRKLVNTVTHPDWKGGRQDVVESGNEWTISSSLAFCFTTITTIGYGVVVPATTFGKIAVVLYSAIGVPFSFLLFADMGGLLARLASKTASSIRKRCRGKNLRKFKELGDSDSDGSTTVYRDHHAVYRDPTSGSEKVVGDNSEGISLEEGSTLSGSKRQSRIVLQKQPSYLASVLEEDDTGDVPCVVVILLLLSYMCIGALSFSLSEGWSYLDAFYFTFITLTTIGFGDLYPVKHIENNSLFPCMIYTLVGLCCLSMCITLLQSRFIKLIRSIKFKAKSITRYHSGETTDGPDSPG